MTASEVPWRILKPLGVDGCRLLYLIGRLEGRLWKPLQNNLVVCGVMMLRDDVISREVDKIDVFSGGCASSHNYGTCDTPLDGSTCGKDNFTTF